MINDFRKIDEIIIYSILSFIIHSILFKVSQLKEITKKIIHHNPPPKKKVFELTVKKSQISIYL